MLSWIRGRAPSPAEARRASGAETSTPRPSTADAAKGRAHTDRARPSTSSSSESSSSSTTTSSSSRSRSPNASGTAASALTSAVLHTGSQSLSASEFEDEQHHLVRGSPRSTAPSVASSSRFGGNRKPAEWLQPPRAGNAANTGSVLLNPRGSAPAGSDAEELNSRPTSSPSTLTPSQGLSMFGGTRWGKQSERQRSTWNDLSPTGASPTSEDWMWNTRVAAVGSVVSDSQTPMSSAGTPTDPLRSLVTGQDPPVFRSAMARPRLTQLISTPPSRVVDGVCESRLRPGSRPVSPISATAAAAQGSPGSFPATAGVMSIFKALQSEPAVQQPTVQVEEETKFKRLVIKPRPGAALPGRLGPAAGSVSLPTQSGLASTRAGLGSASTDSRIGKPHSEETLGEGINGAAGGADEPLWVLPSKIRASALRREGTSTSHQGMGLSDAWKAPVPELNVRGAVGGGIIFWLGFFLGILVCEVERRRLAREIMKERDSASFLAQVAAFEWSSKQEAVRERISSSLDMELSIQYGSGVARSARGSECALDEFEEDEECFPEDVKQEGGESGSRPLATPLPIPSSSPVFPPPPGAAKARALVEGVGSTNLDLGRWKHGASLSGKSDREEGLEGELANTKDKLAVALSHVDGYRAWFSEVERQTHQVNMLRVCLELSKGAEQRARLAADKWRTETEEGEALLADKCRENRKLAEENEILKRELATLRAASMTAGMSPAVKHPMHTGKPLGQAHTLPRHAKRGPAGETLCYSVPQHAPPFMKYSRDR